MRTNWIIAALALMLVSGLIGFAYSASKLSKPPMFAPPTQLLDIYTGVPLDEHLLQLDKEALDDAYSAHLLLLFSVWLKDQAEDPTRINNGLRIARRAYGHAAEQISKREKAIQEINHAK